jgi:hypothetical protein
MRKLFKAIGILGVGILVSAAACGAAEANTVTANCTLFPVVFAGGTGSTSVSCPGFSGSGTLTGASLTLQGDYQFGSDGSNDVRISFSVLEPGGVTWADSAPFGDVTGGISSGAALLLHDAATAGVSNAAFLSAFNVGVSSAVIAGSAATSSGAVQITYTFTPTTVPEPITLSLFGAGLAGAAALRRRKKKAD